jgi:hypothetical protein
MKVLAAAELLDLSPDDSLDETDDSDATPVADQPAVAPARATAPELRPCDQCGEPTRGRCSIRSCTDALCGTPACVQYHVDDVHDGGVLADE